MKKKSITLVKDIELSKGTVVPNLYPDNKGIRYRVFLRKGTELAYEQYSSAGISYAIEKDKNGKSYIYPVDYHIFDMAYNIAIKDGGKPIETEDDNKMYKMFSLITENRITPEEGNYITSFYEKSLDIAEKEAAKFVEKHNLGINFKYIVRE